MVVLAVTGILVLLVAAVAGQVRASARRNRCRANLRQISLALQLYAQDNRSLLPDCTTNNPAFFGGWWPWDMRSNLVNNLAQLGAGRQFLYCPSNPTMNDDHHWNFWRYDQTAPGMRIIGYCFLLNGNRGIPEELWRTDLDGAGSKAPAQTELEMDATGSMGGSPWVLNATLNADIDYTHIQGKWMDRSSHLTGLFEKIRPAGGNVGFEDGHVAWRDFSEMRPRFSTGGNGGAVTWDF